MELIFKYNQTSFIRASQIDRAIYNGLCFIMCIDYLYNKEKNLPCDYDYFSNICNFTSRYRAMLYYYQGGGAGKDPYLMNNGKIKLTNFRKTEHPIEIYLLKKGIYIINLSLSKGTQAHAMAYIKRPGETLFFDPNHGEYNIKNKLNSLNFINQEYNSYGIDYLSIYQASLG
ncbi:TPA: hypothetical protein HNJ20_20885 [Escherichia coli]|nr:hypothetical protein [Escherichia coli]